MAALQLQIDELKLASAAYLVLVANGGAAPVLEDPRLAQEAAGVLRMSRALTTAYGAFIFSVECGKYQAANSPAHWRIAVTAV
jgi:hypothetical protein